jgi:hypothetical protein
MTTATWSVEEFKALCDTFGERLAADEGFRGRALADAPAALRELAGRDLPPDSERLKLTQTDEGLMLAAEETDELSENELDGVVGGMSLGAAAATVLMGAVAGGYLAGSGEAGWSRSSRQDVTNAIIFGAVAGAGAGVGAVIATTIKGG